MLRAEPDHKTLGFRLKGAFKDVTKEIKGLTDDHLTEFVKSGKMTLLGHDIGPEDVRIMYTFDATKVSQKNNRDCYHETTYSKSATFVCLGSLLFCAYKVLSKSAEIKSQ